MGNSVAHPVLRTADPADPADPAKAYAKARHPSVPPPRRDGQG
ncbi:hypothetical protein ACFCYM_10980 [Streptomyces sp. NPDC056254]